MTSVTDCVSNTELAEIYILVYFSAHKDEFEASYKPASKNPFFQCKKEEISNFLL